MNKFVQDYLSKAKSDLDDARFLVEGSRYTASLTRSYYAAWNSIQALLISKNVAPKTHLGTHVKFNEIFIKTGIFPKAISDKLSLLEQLRETSDYEPDYRATVDEASNALSDAQHIITMVEAYFKQ
jgi:uncharacterized protein (UPF0332 family)